MFTVNRPASLAAIMVERRARQPQELRGFRHAQKLGPVLVSAFVRSLFRHCTVLLFLSRRRKGLAGTAPLWREKMGPAHFLPPGTKHAKSRPGEVSGAARGQSFTRLSPSGSRGSRGGLSLLLPAQ